jgi:hypothetical protein
MKPHTISEVASGGVLRTCVVDDPVIYEIHHTGKASLDDPSFVPHNHVLSVAI